MIQSVAHQRSAFAVIDPLYSTEQMLPSPDVRSDVAPWLYGYGELECYRLQQLRRNVGKARLKVRYPGNFHRPAEHVFFRHRAVNTDIIVLYAVGAMRILVGSCEIRKPNTKTPHQIILPVNLPPESYLMIEFFAEDEPPAILIEHGPYSTAGNGWEWSADTVNWEVPKVVLQTKSGLAPHRSKAAEVILPPANNIDGLFDFGCELFGTVTIYSMNKPEISVGESPVEAQNTIPEYCEQSIDVHACGNNKWSSLNPMAFRYIKATGLDTKNIVCHAHMHPTCYQGAFACSDEQLTRIWMNSAYTLRLCMQDFILDGIKRDRLPWVGDLAMSMMCDAYTFGDAEIVRRSLTALGRDGIARSHLNGIFDYSLWWIIAHNCFQRYFGDKTYLLREWARIKDMVSCINASCDSNGMLVSSSKDWIFIDWVEGEKLTALQILWWWALNSVAKLADRLDEKDYASQCRKDADKVAFSLHDNAWDTQQNLWISVPGDYSSVPSRHANFLSVLSGLAQPEQMASIQTALLDNAIQPVGTPYMAGFENIALSRLGAVEEMMSRVNSYWGGMLEHGATTFWEAYDSTQQGNESYSFYGRPFGKSLCHAWSAGPAAFLPMGIFGLEPLEDGWKRFKIKPDLGKLTWASVTVPTPQGNIEITIENGIMSLRVPPGVIAEYQGHELTEEVILKVFN